MCPAMSAENVVQVRPYHFCVVDEADSILIDEARTPLIISRKGNKYSGFIFHLLLFLNHS